MTLVGITVEATILIFEVPTGALADAVSRRLSAVVGYTLLGAAFLLIVLAQVVSGIGYALVGWSKDAPGSKVAMERS